MKKIYYGYIILITCFFIVVLSYGSQYSFGVFYKPLIRDFGWSRAETAGPYALGQFMIGVFSIITGRLSDKIGSRRVIMFGSLVLGTGYILTSCINNLWQFYLTYGFVIAAGTSAMYVPIVSLLTRWFARKPGAMVGLGISGIGFGVGVVPIIASNLVAHFGWRISVLSLGVAVLLFVFTLSLLLKDPETRGGPVSRRVSSSKEYSFTEAVHTRQFWMFCVAWIFYGFVYQVGLVHLIPHATDIGMTATAAATLLTVIGLVGTPARISLGISGDRFGNRPTFIIAYGLIGLVYLGLAFNNSIWMLYVFAVIFGALNGVGILLAPIAAEYYGYRSLGIIVGVIIFANNIGNAISPPLAGFIYDKMKSYEMAFLICGVVGFAAAVIMWYLRYPKPGARDAEKASTITPVK